MKTRTQNDPIRRAIALWQSGKDTAEIAHAVGLEESTVYNILARWRS
ncbi:terminase gpP N-terminus-related DNA-binding protein [Ancylobacter oerskovii]|uniref:Helix-turn-helix domain-containing protein n=1 Tax=Ancylobacter oerskovii TaxID=459519 RepID=A0ABW4Z1S4_9HYPH|nr:helix-turn-helix domain-containing protein [Ancylobacter oerskovii]MBS7545095.1 helix-turn-helix domain-containing protein [Ancylobacter oerskovii]